MNEEWEMINEDEMKNLHSFNDQQITILSDTRNCSFIIAANLCDSI